MPLKLLLVVAGQLLGGPEYPVQGHVGSTVLLNWQPPAPSALAADADTLALWRFDEANVGDPAVNAVADGGTLTPNGGNEPEIGVINGARRTSFGNRLTGPLASSIQSAMLAGQATIEFWAQRDANGGEPFGAHLEMGDGTAAHYLFALYWAVADYHWHVFWQYAGGASSYDLDTGWVIPLGGWHHYAVVLTPTGGGACTADAYVDGVSVLHSTGKTLPNPGGGTQGLYLGVGDNLSSYHNGEFDELRISGSSRSAAEILADYRASGRWSSPPASAVGATPALTRASVGYYETSAGHVVNALSGELRCGYQGCLVEPGRTNQVLYSSAFDNAAWGKYGVGTSAPSISANAGAAPDGTFSADQVTWPSGVAVGQASILEPAAGLSVTTGQNYTWSVWLKTTSGTASVYLSFDNSTGPVQPTLATASTTWTRFSITRNIGAGDLGTGSLLYPELAIDRRGGVEADQSGPVLLVWGAQLEQGDFATTNIPTTGTSVARASDVLSVSASGLIKTKGGVRVNFTPEWASASVTPTVFGSDTAAQLSLSVGSDVLAFKSGGATISSASLGWTTFSAHSVVGNWTSTNGSLKVDGVKVNGSAPTPSVTALYLGGTSTVGGGVSLSRVKVCKGGCP